MYKTNIVQSARTQKTTAATFLSLDSGISALQANLFYVYLHVFVKEHVTSDGVQKQNNAPARRTELILCVELSASAA